jgi:N-acetyl-anhydromuramyl-L-alanine amidase AmpD
VYRQPIIHSILQEWFDGLTMDANMRILAIELTGSYFNTQGHIPSSQQIANAIGLIWAMMKRYGMRASTILGQHEISLDKSDPGKRFMALIRCLLGAKALTEKYLKINKLVFGQQLSSGHKPIQAVIIYLRWVRDYMTLVS